MKSLTSSVLLIGLGLLLSVAAIGCATTPAPAEDAVMCPKCETIWLEPPDIEDPFRLTFSAQKSMQCPDCHTAVATFFRTGEWTHSCDTCGGELVHCTQRR